MAKRIAPSIKRISLVTHESETDLMTTTLNNIVSNFDVSKVYFKTAFGLVLESVHNGNSFTLTLPAAKTNEAYELFAYTDVNVKPQVLGKLDVFTFPFVHQKVCLVPVKVSGKEPIVPNIKEVSEKLNAIYLKYGVAFEVSVADSVFNNQTDWDYYGDGKLDISGKGLFSNLSDEMKALRGSYTLSMGETLKPDVSYLFLLDAVYTDDTKADRIDGNMPRGQQFGYLFGNFVLFCSLL